jgi:hypothetical protein
MRKIYVRLSKSKRGQSASAIVNACWASLLIPGKSSILLSPVTVPIGMMILVDPAFTWIEIMRTRAESCFSELAKSDPLAHSQRPIHRSGNSDSLIAQHQNVPRVQIRDAVIKVTWMLHI